MEDAALVMLDSLLLHNPSLQVDLFHYGDVTAARFAGLPVRLRQVAPIGLGETEYFSAAANDAMALRLRALDTLLAEGRRGTILYLDADLLVQGDLSPLFDCRFPPGFFLAAAADYICNDPTSPHYPAFDKFHAHRMRLNPNYFNTGVMVLQLEGLRHCIAATGQSRLVDMVRERYPDFVWPDQDLLNQLIAEYVPLDAQRYNARPDVQSARLYDQAQFTALRLGLMQAVILHFAGPLKPFNKVVPPDPLSMQLPYENYARAVERVAHLVDAQFLAVVKRNVENHLPVIRRFRTLLAMERDPPR